MSIDEQAETRRLLTLMCEATGSWTADVARQALALLDAKDAEIARSSQFELTALHERNAALSRAEQAEAQHTWAMQARDEAEAALAEERKAHGAFRREVSDAVRENCGRWPIDTALARFILPAKPDPLVAVFQDAGVVPTGLSIMDGVARLRAAIERHGGVKAVFGEGLAQRSNQHDR